MLIAGFLSGLACLALLGDMLVAILTAKLSGLPKGVSPLNWLDNFLYLPEALYALFFVWLICSGPGRFSVDPGSPPDCGNGIRTIGRNLNHGALLAKLRQSCTEGHAGNANISCVRHIHLLDHKNCS